MHESIGIGEIIKKQRTFFESGKTKNVNFRIKQLSILKNAIEEFEDEILNSIYKDLNKVKFEAYETEIGLVISEINSVKKKLSRWAKPQRVKSSILNPGAKAYIYKDPHGLCLIMSPWNYPFYLTIAPLVGAIMGGNCAIVKPSRFSENTTKTIKKMIDKYFDEEYIYVVFGEHVSNQHLLTKEFDYIFFTGSPTIGKKVMEAAAKNLTPLTLELGGKSPTIVHKSANINKSAKKIVWGKLINGGQTCIAPDYIIVHKDIKKQLIENMERYIREFYEEEPLMCNHYPKIINEKHFNRILGLINKEKIVYGGKYDEEKLKIEPTILDYVNMDDNVMKEEIFGPIIPLIEYEKEEEIFEIIEHNKYPLALYIFSEDNNFVDKTLDKVSFGGGCVNDTIMHITNENIPFGGVRNSGIGSYHGYNSFRTFTHEKSVVKSTFAIDFSFMYPPYTEKAFRIMKKIFNR